MKTRLAILLGSLFCMYPYPSSAQSALKSFGQQQQWQFQQEYNQALHYLNKHKEKSAYNFANGQCLQVVGLQNNIPLFYITHNAEAANYIGIPESYIDTDVHTGLSGRNVKVGVWDAGHVLNTHPEFLHDDLLRVQIQSEVPHFVNHSTHVGGTIAAFGVDEQAKGMAYLSTIYSYDYVNDIAEMAMEAEQQLAFVSNHSYGPVNGWQYNSEEEKWYWYGDVGIDEKEEYKFGFYGAIPAALDELAYLAPNYLMVVSAGNDRHEAPETQPISHKVWVDKWVGSNDVREIDGGDDGYDCLGMNAVAKNVLTVGAVDFLENGEVSSYSAWGPTDDGRMKPDLVAPGTQIYSTLADSTNLYGYYSGTSMAAACVTGGVALLMQLQEKLQPRVTISAATIKGIFIHSADECGWSDGPDYQYGWGLVNFSAAHQLLEQNVSSGGNIIHEVILEKGVDIERHIELKDTGDVKVTLVWTDLADTAEIPALNPKTLNLINDLDVCIKQVSTGTTFFPWVLDPDNPSKEASTGINTRDNVEQVVLKDAVPGEYVIYIDNGKLNAETQNASLIITGHMIEEGLYPPENLDGFFTTEGIALQWSAPVIKTPDGYRIYRNNELLCSSVEPQVIDSYACYGESYTYKVAACYGEEETMQSLFTNGLTVKALPVYQLNLQEQFEFSPDYWTFANNAYGWRWGSTVDLSSEHLTFEGNETHFMGINSDALGNGEHVTDYLVSIPFVLPTAKEIEVQFKYCFDNEGYNTNDTFELRYRNSMNKSWVTLKTIPSVESWSTYKAKFKFTNEEEIIQLGFYYDDNEQWGYGAAIDDVQIVNSAIFTNTKPKSQTDDLRWYVDENKNVFLQLTTTDMDANQSIKVFDITGKLVFTLNTSESRNQWIQIPLQHLTDGLYLFNIRIGSAFVSKLIVLH